LIEIEGLESWRELGLVYRRDRSLPRAAAAFIELARQPSAMRGTDAAAGSAKHAAGAGTKSTPAHARPGAAPAKS